MAARIAKKVYSTLGGFTYIWQCKQVGVIEVKIEKMWIRFLSDLPWSSSVLELPIECQNLMFCFIILVDSSVCL